jgi:hypothetical protein
MVLGPVRDRRRRTADARWLRARPAVHGRSQARALAHIPERAQRQRGVIGEQRPTVAAVSPMVGAQRRGAHARRPAADHLDLFGAAHQPSGRHDQALWFHDFPSEVKPSWLMPADGTINLLRCLAEMRPASDFVV